MMRLLFVLGVCLMLAGTGMAQRGGGHTALGIGLASTATPIIPIHIAIRMPTHIPTDTNTLTTLA